MNKIKYLIAIFSLILQVDLIAQNNLWLTNGKRVNIREYKIENPDLIVYKSLKGKSKSIQTFEVFAIADSTGKEQVVYLPDTSYQGAFTIIEMRSFVQGQYDADLKYKSPWTTVGGVAVAGLGGAVVNPFYVILIPVAYCSGIGLTKTREKKLGIPTEFAQNEHYILGYKREVKHWLCSWFNCWFGNFCYYS
jgi:hypothetical protein